MAKNAPRWLPMLDELERKMGKSYARIIASMRAQLLSEAKLSPNRSKRLLEFIRNNLDSGFSWEGDIALTPDQKKKARKRYDVTSLDYQAEPLSEVDELREMIVGLLAEFDINQLSTIASVIGAVATGDAKTQRIILECFWSASGANEHDEKHSKSTSEAREKHYKSTQEALEKHSRSTFDELKALPILTQLGPKLSKVKLSKDKTRRDCFADAQHRADLSLASPEDELAEPVGDLMVSGSLASPTREGQDEEFVSPQLDVSLEKNGEVENEAARMTAAHTRSQASGMVGAPLYSTTRNAEAKLWLHSHPEPRGELIRDGERFRLKFTTYRAFEGKLSQSSELPDDRAFCHWLYDSMGADHMAAERNAGTVSALPEGYRWAWSPLYEATDYQCERTGLARAAVLMIWNGHVPEQVVLFNGTSELVEFPLAPNAGRSDKAPDYKGKYNVNARADKTT
ncbi:hypothetical protein [Azospirillum rugosum]|uniref:Uncharacterized protein n=1 Tax=Azospirillum rugosum TaxID=416170 RepID=A0ABS4SRH9_9PROT|nr:hypothetical protein [Azospirillum rugosum]MBP2295160.1 hypothetical protein [Azospirillum rugosum]MDQ0528534.1 hypothetical protein [Azospirillum rugosum]